MNSLNNVLI